MYQIISNQFSGPIEKLLSLIEEKKMEITEVNLAAITADFIDYLKKIETAAVDVSSPVAFEIRNLADFVIIAATLILIKSKSILPRLELSGEEEASIKDLEERLKIYAAFKPAITLFGKFYSRGEFSVSRPLLFNFPAMFYPAPNVTNYSLGERMESLFEEFKKFSLEEEKIEAPLIKLEEKVAEIVERLEAGANNFSSMIQNKSRIEIVVLFLALLHLLKEQIIKIEQPQGFADIVISCRSRESEDSV